jgi:hypothetical protein
MRHRKFAILNTEANRDLIEYLKCSQYAQLGRGPSMSDKSDTYFTFTINRSGCIGNRRDVSSAKLYERNEYDENVPLAIKAAEPRNRGSQFFFAHISRHVMRPQRKDSHAPHRPSAHA